MALAAPARHTIMSRAASWLGALAALVATVNASTVLADGWKVQLTGVKALGVGYAGRAAAEDATTVWFNAAGMSRLHEPWTVTFGGAAIPFALDYTDAGSRSLLGQPLTGAASVNGGQAAFVPHAFVVRRLGDRWHVGGGFNAPYGLEDDYGDSWVGRYHATKSSLRVVNLSSAISVALTKQLSVAIGLDVQRASTRLANRIDFGSVAVALGMPAAPQGLDGGISFSANNWDVGYDLSAAWQPSGRARIAATYREAVSHSLRGEASFDVPAAAAPLAGAAFQATRATGVLPMPRELSLATAVDVGRSGKWTVVGDVTWTGWSRFQALSLEFENPAQLPIAQEARFSNSLRGAGGIVFRATNRWTLRAGGLYEDTPVPDLTRTPRLPEVDNVGLTVGGTRRFSDRWDVDFAWSHLIPHGAAIGVTEAGAGTLNGRIRWRTDSIALGTSLRF